MLFQGLVLELITMRLYTFIFLLTAICSSRDSGQSDTIRPLDNALMVGEWQVDSSANGDYLYDRLIILEDGSFYMFSGSDGGSMSNAGRKFDETLLATDHGDTMNINLLDSNQLYVSGGWNNIENYYRRWDFGDYRENLKEYFQSDSLRKKVLGWWKLKASRMPVNLINYSGYFENFTLNIREDGQAVFYLENKLDSTVDYFYKVNPDGIDFIRGCVVGSDCKIEFDERNRMKLLLDEMRGDTLLLERLTEIK